jgi:curli biogenesis system outer membrane secretion channel CsgG
MKEGKDTMKTIYALALAAALCLPQAAFAEEAASTDTAAKPAAEAAKPADAAPQAAPAEKSYTAAVLPFTADKEFDDMGQQVPLLLNAFLSASPSTMMVERAEVDKALSEVELGKSGTVDPETAAKVGHLIGAQVLVTGRIFPVQKDLIIVAKIIGVETGRVYGETVSLPLRGNIKDASQQLADKIAADISAKGETMIVHGDDKVDMVAKLKPLMEGKKNLPTVSVTIDAMNIGKTDTDTTAQTEIAYILQNLGFTVIDPMASNKKADIEVTGTAVSEFAMRKGNLVSAKAHVEIKALRHKDGTLVLVDREPTVAVDLSPESAGKLAQAKSASALSERLVKALTAAK